MNYEEYTKYVKSLSKEELEDECLSLKENWDKSCRSWSNVEALRVKIMDMFNELKNYSTHLVIDFNDKIRDLITEYNNMVQEQNDKERNNGI